MSDAYEVLKMWKEMGKIEKIKTIRAILPGISLLFAKDLVEAAESAENTMKNWEIIKNGLREIELKTNDELERSMVSKVLSMINTTHNGVRWNDAFRDHLQKKNYCVK